MGVSTLRAPAAKVTEADNSDFITIRALTRRRLQLCALNAIRAGTVYLDIDTTADSYIKYVDIIGQAGHTSWGISLDLDRHSVETVDASIDHDSLLNGCRLAWRQSSVRNRNKSDQVLNLTVQIAFHTSHVHVIGSYIAEFVSVGDIKEAVKSRAGRISATVQLQTSIDIVQHKVHASGRVEGNGLKNHTHCVGDCAHRGRGQRHPAVEEVQHGAHHEGSRNNRHPTGSIHTGYHRSSCGRGWPSRRVLTDESSLIIGALGTTATTVREGSNRDGVAIRTDTVCRSDLLAFTSHLVDAPNGDIDTAGNGNIKDIGV